MQNTFTCLSLSIKGTLAPLSSKLKHKRKYSSSLDHNEEGIEVMTMSLKYLERDDKLQLQYILSSNQIVCAWWSTDDMTVHLLAGLSSTFIDSAICKMFIFQLQRQNSNTVETLLSVSKISLDLQQISFFSEIIANTFIQFSLSLRNMVIMTLTIIKPMSYLNFMKYFNAIIRFWFK